MRRLSIGRLIAVAFAVTVVLLFSIDTTLACRYLWRQRRCTPVYYCPPACQVVTYSSCGSEVIHGGSEVIHGGSEFIHGEAVRTPAAGSRVIPTPADPPPPVESLDDGDEDSPVDGVFDDGAAVAPGDEPALDAPADDDNGLDFLEEPATDDGADLPDMPEDDVFTDPLPDDNPADAGVDDLLPGDDADLPADDGALPGDTPDDDLDDLFSDTEAAGNGEARVANNPDEEVDDLIEDIDVDDPTELPADDADVPDDLFPADDAEPAEDGTDDLDDLFGQAPEASETELLGFREVDSTIVEPKVTTTVEPAKPALLFRVWTDNTGNYRTVGQLVKINATHVRLLKDNGRYSTVPKRRLSENDLAYVQRIAKQLDIDANEKIASR